MNVFCDADNGSVTQQFPQIQFDMEFLFNIIDQFKAHQGIPAESQERVVQVKMFDLQYPLESRAHLQEDLICPVNNVLCPLLRMPLGIIPTSGSALVRGVSFMKLVFSRRVSVGQALKLFRKDRRTDYESRVMRLSRQALLSTAEIIKCVEQDVFSLPSERVLMEKVYGDSETTCQNIASLMKNSRSSQAVTLAVANLYLRQQIIFERIST